MKNSARVFALMSEDLRCSADWEKLKAWVGNDPVAFAEVLTSLREDVDRHIEALRLACLNAQWESVCSVAHAARGMFATVGCTRSAAECKRIEELHEWGVEDAQPLIDLLECMHGEVNRQLMPLGTASGSAS